MKNIAFILLLSALALAQACSPAAPGAHELPASVFAERLQSSPGALLLDVRTPEEFAKGHLPDARNIDWNGPDFAPQTATLDKAAPVFVYCLSGARSADAARQLRAEGFAQVLELQGGILKWRAAGLPEAQGAEAPPVGMSLTDYEALLKMKQLVLVDFYADWCAPCKKMAPYLAEIQSEMTGRISVVRINADDNPALLRALGVDALPVLLLYQNGALVWRNTGFVEKAAVLAKIEAF